MGVPDAGGSTVLGDITAAEGDGKPLLRTRSRASLGVMWGAARVIPARVAIAAVVLLGLFGAAPALAATAGPPTAVVASARDSLASVSFAPPSSDGGSPITSYTVTASPGGMTASGASSPIVISGLTDGVPYTFTVTAVNASGPGTPSSPSPPVTPLAPPAATTDPVILGTPEVGQTLFATSGSWTGTPPPQLSYQWLDCDQSSGNCFGVAGVTSGANYTVSPLDGGYTIEVLVTAVNSDIEYTSDPSAPTSTIVAAPGAPIVQGAPTLSAVDASEPVAATSGSWSGAPTGYSYEWYACSPAPGECHPVTGLSSLTSFTPARDEDGDYLEVAVVASNGSGSSVPAFSGASGTISLPPPTISISWPADGAVYSPGLSPGATEALYTCTAAAGATINSCAGTVAAGSAVPFSPGSHALTVTATDSAGERATRTVSYTVGGAPAITLTGPVNGATYAQGFSLPVSAACAAFDGSSLACTMAQSPQPACQAKVALVGCANASQLAGSPQLDTQTLGSHTFTVTATDAFAESASLTVSYTVVAAPPSVTAGADARLRITRLSQSSSRWRIGGGTRFSFDPNLAALVTFVFQRDLTGRRSAGRCVAETSANLHDPACTRTQRVGSLRRFEPGGIDVVPFDGRLGGSSLAPGSYTVAVSATAIGATSPLVYSAGTLKFTVAG